MSKKRYKDLKFPPANLAIIEAADAIIEEYQDQDMRMTLRQIYYVFISKDILPDSWIDPEYNRKHNLDPDTKNTIKNYKRLGGLISDGRLAGLLDWDGLVDRGRQASMTQSFDNLKELAEVALNAYRLPRWEGQEHYCELWVEKDALAEVLQPLARDFHVALVINKGYSSSSAMYEAAQRFIHDGRGKFLNLFYIGDFDPSGEDMVRDIDDRLRLFGVRDLNVEKVGLTLDQVRNAKKRWGYALPPNPAKTSDGRAGVKLHKDEEGNVIRREVLKGGYVDKHGWQSWEVDAIRPPQLAAMVRDAFIPVLDVLMMEKVKKREETDKKELRKAVEKILKGKK